MRRLLLVAVLFAVLVPGGRAEKQRAYVPVAMWTAIDFTKACKQVSPNRMKCDAVEVTFAGYELATTPPGRQREHLPLSRIRIEPQAAK